MGGGHLGSRRRLGVILGRRQLFPHAGRAGQPTLDELLPLISVELRRARRYERQLSALAFDVEAYSELPRGRATDIVAVSESHGLVLVVLPEAGPESAERYADRLERGTGFTPVNSASFPDDALTLDVLMQLALEV